MPPDDLESLVRSESGRAAVEGRPPPSFEIHNHFAPSTAVPSSRSSGSGKKKPKRRKRPATSGGQRRRTTAKRTTGTRRPKTTAKRRVSAKRATPKRATKKAFLVNFEVNGVPSTTTVRAAGAKSAQRAIKSTLPSATRVTAEPKASKRKSPKRKAAKRSKRKAKR